MRKATAAAAVLSATMFGLAAQGAISITGSDAVALPGSPATINVSIISDTAVSAVQFDVSVSTTNLLVAGSALGAAATDHQLSTNELATGSNRYVVYSPTSAALGNDVLVSLSYDVRTTAYGSAPVVISNVRISTADGTLLDADTIQNGNVVITEEDSDNDNLADSLEQRIINFRHTVTAFPEFQMPINATTTGRADVTLTVGYAFSATDDVDNGVDVAAEAGAPIVINSVSGDELSTDVRAAGLVFEWILCAKADAGSPVNLTWDVNDVPDNHSVTLARIDTQRSAADTSGTRIDMNVTDNVTIAPGDCWRLVFARGLVNFDFVSGWNLISLPIDPDSPGADAIFSDLQNVIFEYSRPVGNGSPRFLVPQTLSAKAGVWVYFDKPTTIGVTGIKPQQSGVTLKKGWNLVGFVEQIPVPDNPDLRGTPYFWDAGGRRMRKARNGTLDPGLAYFMFARQDTEIDQ
jgi:hypothetical protein